MAYSLDKKTSSDVVTIFDTKIYPPQHTEILKITAQQEEPSIHGDTVWEASFVLMDFIDKFPLNPNSRVLEIGCGWGGLTAFLATRVIGDVSGLDADAAVQAYFDYHAQANGVSMDFIHGTMKSMTKQKLQAYDVIIGGDICFWDSLKNDWQNLIRRALQSQVNEIYITDPGRPPFWDLVEYAEKHFAAELWSHDVKQPYDIEQYVLEIKRC